MEPLRLEFTVACPPERAFALWAEQTTRWWPHGHSVSGAVAAEPARYLLAMTPRIRRLIELLHEPGATDFPALFRRNASELL